MGLHGIEDEDKDYLMIMINGNDLMIMVITGAHQLLMNQEAHS